MIQLEVFCPSAHRREQFIANIALCLFDFLVGWHFALRLIYMGKSFLVRYEHCLTLTFVIMEWLPLFFNVLQKFELQVFFIPLQVPISFGVDFFTFLIACPFLKFCLHIFLSHGLLFIYIIFPGLCRSLHVDLETLISFVMEGGVPG